MTACDDDDQETDEAAVHSFESGCGALAVWLATVGCLCAPGKRCDEIR